MKNKESQKLSEGAQSVEQEASYWQNKKDELDSGVYDDDEDEAMMRENIEEQYRLAMQKVKEQSKLPSQQDQALTTEQVIKKFDDYILAR